LGNLVRFGVWGLGIGDWGLGLAYLQISGSLRNI